MINRTEPTIDMFLWWLLHGWGKEDNRPDDGIHWTDWWFKMEPIEDEL